MGETYYEVLGVDPDATRDEIESAYRDRVLETHPDHSDDPDAAEQFKRVTTARSVLTDGTERARYDRLGHETYVGLAQEPGAGANGDEGEETGDEPNAAETSRDGSGDRTGSERSASGSATDRTNAETSSTDTGTNGSDSGGGQKDPFQQWASEWVSQSESDADATDRGRSHHARQRSERRRRRARQRARGEWPFDGDRTRRDRSATAETATSGGTTAGAAAANGTATHTATAGNATTGTDGGEGFQYSVHDWDGEVDLEWDGQTIDQTTAVTVGFVALCYPLFVAASLTTLFSLPVNAVIAACTFVVVGYLLTMPRIAIATFGAWSVLFPIGIVQLSVIDLFSVFGLLAIAFAWVPLGYAVALWWVLRP